MAQHYPQRHEGVLHTSQEPFCRLTTSLQVHKAVFQPALTAPKPPPATLYTTTSNSNTSTQAPPNLPISTNPPGSKQHEPNKPLTRSNNHPTINLNPQLSLSQSLPESQAPANLLAHSIARQVMRLTPPHCCRPATNHAIAQPPREPIHPLGTMSLSIYHTHLSPIPPPTLSQLA